MKTLIFSLLLLVTNLTFAQKVNFKILKDKTEVDKQGFITLYAEVINKTKNDITILKPSTDFNQKWRYYTSEMDCEIRSPWFAMETKKINYNDSDLLLIAAKSKLIIKVNGRLNTNSLSCQSDQFEVKLKYDISELIEDDKKDRLTFDEKSILEKLTSIKIESKKTKIKMDKK